jgi:hypothetical protein
MKRFLRLFSGLALAISLLPSVFADVFDGLETIGNLFFSVASLGWITDVIPATKSALFLVVFSLIYAILGTGLWKGEGLFKGSNGKKVAGVVAFSFAAIAILFMPDRLVFEAGSMISGVFALLLICFIPGLLLLVTFKATKTEGDGKPAIWQHAVRVMVILVCISLISMIADQYDGSFGYFLIPLMFIVRARK